MRFFKPCAIGALALTASVSSIVAQRADTTAREEKPAIELGGYVTVDFLSDMNDFSNPTLRIGEVDLGANVNISDEVVASVLIKTWSRLDSLWIDQALVSYTPRFLPLEFLFGQQRFNHGLLTTRLIGDPLLLDAVELIKPGVILNGTLGLFTGGLGVTTFQRTEEGSDPENRFSGIVNIDAALPNESIARISSSINESSADMDLAGIITFRKLSIDVEGLFTISTADSLKPSGFYAGASYTVTDRVGLAARADGISEDTFKELELRYAGGMTVKIKDGIFFAVELSRMKPAGHEAYNEIAFETGLERTIQLPGFQRKTLTKE